MNDVTTTTYVSLTKYNNVIIILCRLNQQLNCTNVEKCADMIREWWAVIVWYSKDNACNLKARATTGKKFILEEIKGPPRVRTYNFLEAQSLLRNMFIQAGFSTPKSASVIKMKLLSLPARKTN